MYQQARARDAGLSRGRENPRDSTFNGIIHVGIVKDDVGGFAAKLQRHGFQMFGGGFVNSDAARLTAGKGDLCHIRMVNQRHANLQRHPGDGIDHACRKTRLGEQLHKFQGRGGGVFRRLDHHGIARCQQGRELPCQQQKRRVPRHNRGNHPQWLMPGKGEHIGLVDRQHSAFDLVGQPAEITKPLGDIAQLGGHFRQQFAVVTGFNGGQTIRMDEDQIGETVQQFAARRGGQTSPIARFEGSFRGSHRRVDLILAIGGDQRPRLAREGIEGFKID